MATTLPATSPRCVNATRSCRSSLLTRPAQFFNAIYVLGADKSDASSLYIYNVAGKSWSKQSVNAGSLDTSDFQAILDHDTNVFCEFH